MNGDQNKMLIITKFILQEFKHINKALIQDIEDASPKFKIAMNFWRNTVKIPNNSEPKKEKMKIPFLTSHTYSSPQNSHVLYMWSITFQIFSNHMQIYM